MSQTPAPAHGLDDVAVAITGGCGILGTAFAEAFLAANARVALLDLAAAEPARAAADLAARLGVTAERIIGLPCDVGNPDDVEAAFDRLDREAGPPGVLINNAASKSSHLRRFFEPAESFDPEIWREVMAVNLDGMFLAARAAAARMLDPQPTDAPSPDAGNASANTPRGGSIVQIASVYGVVAPNQSIYEGSHYLGGPISTPPVYSASKSGVIGLTRHLAACWGARGVRVNCVSPGGVFSGQNDEFRRRYSERVPLGRMAEAREIASAVLFLASPAASYVNGHNLVVDGGMSIW